MNHDVFSRDLARRFYEAAAEIPHENPLPKCVNLALSIELYFKSFSTILERNEEGILISNLMPTHQLDKLFEGLPKQIRDDIRNRYDRDLKKDLLFVSDVFTVDRYIWGLPKDTTSKEQSINLGEYVLNLGLERSKISAKLEILLKLSSAMFT